jgi:hypothetical protein
MIQDVLFLTFYHFQNEEESIEFAQCHTQQVSAKFLDCFSLEAAGTNFSLTKLILDTDSESALDQLTPANNGSLADR